MADNLMGLIPQPKPVYSYATGHTHQLHLKTPLKDPEEYTEWVQIIRGASENDRIELHLNTPGGDIYAAIELLHAFATTAAHIHVVCSGIVASAGTVLMTVGDSFEINPHTTFMFHNYSGGTMGKGNEMAIKIEYERQWSQNFMHDVYEGLLTEDEINDLLDGRDYWLSANDVSERLEAMVEARYKKVEELQQEMEKVLEEALQEVSEEPEVEEKPKRKRGRPRKVKKDE